ncbi:HNH endonuclease [Salimicrobium halophilum]|uniref:5-methylcytosine-specific restriction enzyme A n=1 Tax=Salimicrobium halophilum TaxID=86666 RepID=A0A1G8W724_9BACI|nr:HNH endonuclease signature motif containing protein [Salimicrobium halophilum]SDJ73545.1 5-methylcytosine-specific restriction enzyme A [Salimicrobium halophilum]
MITTLEYNAPFEKGKHYRRTQVHQLYKGQPQNGISTPANYPYIFIFTGDSGEQYGYRDGWNETSTVYYYTGEGQNGNMDFTKGNKAIRDHAENGETIYLFKYVASGIVEFIDEMAYVGHEMRFVPDHDGNEREAIVFYLERIEHIEQESEASPFDASTHSLEQLRAIAGAVETSDDPRETKVQVRHRAAAVKAYALARADGVCEACVEEAPFVKKDGTPFLEVHHLFRLSDGGADKPEAVAAICPNCHRRVHYGQDASSYNDELISRIARQEG